ncbi:MAG: response regulator transcription factor [Bacteroidia bacterium]|nr:response regulator transcription factor [Bacteroidia bacterium]
MKLLLIEDEIALGESIVTYLKKEGYVCEWAKNFQEATDKIYVYKYDCLMVDITIPGGSGLQIIEELKNQSRDKSTKRSDSGVIIISAKNSLDDKIKGLDLGADDYLTKPFHLSELNSRIRSLMRRRLNKGDTLIEFNEIVINPANHEVKVKSSALDLTAKEYGLLLYFITNKNRVLTKEAIAEHLWGDEKDVVDSFDFIYSHIKNLRKKMIDKGGEDYIKTVYGMGYKFGE